MAALPVETLTKLYAKGPDVVFAGGGEEESWELSLLFDAMGAMSSSFNDQAERYTAGNLRDIYFYREDLAGHIEREYHPGAELTAPSRSAMPGAAASAPHP